MASQPDNKIFLGHTPVEQRKYITAVFKHLLPTHPKLVIPAVGQFTLVKCAIEAGYQRENIQTSDISLFSSLLGYLFSGKPIDSIDFEIVDETYRAEYEACFDETEKVAYLMWLMKAAQMSKIHYRKLMYDDLVENRKKHINDLYGQVSKLKQYFDGVQYAIKDLRAELDPTLPADTLFVCNPPVFRKGYTKMFDFRGFINYHSGVEEFDFKNEYLGLYEKSKSLPYPCVWYRFRSVEGFNPDEVIFAKEYEVEKQDYWLITKPEVIQNFAYHKHIASFARKNLRPYHLPIFSETDRIEPNSTVRFVSVPEEVSLYYRDLWAHRLGNTSAEHHFLMLVNEKVFSCVGFTTNKMMRLQTDYIFENYGFSCPLKSYRHNNRLLMLMITSKEFVDVIHATASHKNRYYKCDGMRTTCLSKYRSIKTHAGILKRIERKQLPNGMYYIQAETKWHDRDFRQTLAIWLKEVETGEKQLTSETFAETQVK